MSDAALTLYHDDLWLSPYVASVFIALRAKGVAFSLRPIDLTAGEQRKLPFAKDSITARIPALSHGDFWVSESTAIIDYLDDALPAPQFPRVLPADIRERARARQVMGFCRSDVRDIPIERPTSSLFYPEQRARLKPLSERGQVAMARLLMIAERCIPQGRTSIGSQWSVADADLTLLLQRLALNGERLPDRIHRYIDANWSHPAMQAFVTLPRGPYRDY